MQKKEEKIIFIKCSDFEHFQEDEIDLKNVIEIILKYKKFIFILTFIFTLLGTIYILLKKPIYEIQSSIQLGYIYDVNKNSKLYLLNPYSTKEYLENLYKKNQFNKIKYPTLNINIPKHITSIYNLSIQAFSNKQAINYLNLILKDLKNKENQKIKIIKNNIIKQINILKNTNLNFQKELKILNKKLKIIKNPQIYTIILNHMLKIKTQITQNKLKILSLKEKLSPSNIIHTHIIGTIKKLDKPIKPKKKLIITITFVTGFILSIIFIFFIEYIQSQKKLEISSKK